MHIKDIAENNYSLSIPLYIRTEDSFEEADLSTSREHADLWQEASENMKSSFEALNNMLNKEESK